MRDFKHEIDETDDVHQLRSILAEVNEAVDHLLEMSYEGDAAERRAHELQLIIEYGEHKLDKLLA
jgi:hypothetical protein